MRLLAPGLLVLLMLAGYYIALIQPLVAARSKLSARIETEQSKRLSLEQRLQAFAASDPKLRLRDDLVWRSFEVKDAEIALQNHLIEISRANELTLTVFRTSAIPAGARYARIGVNIEGTGTLAAFYAFMHALEQAERKTATSSLLIRRSNQRDRDAAGVEIGFRATFWAYWEAME